jgi:hypothetical protein
MVTKSLLAVFMIDPRVQLPFSDQRDEADPAASRAGSPE